MRILHFLPHLLGGGAERQFSYLAQEQFKLGHEVHVAYLENDGENSELQGIVKHSLRSFSNYDPVLLWQVICIIRRIKPCVIQTWILQMHVLGGIAAKLTSTPWIFREPSCENAYLGSWKIQLLERIVSWASVIVSNSRGGDKIWENKAPNSRRYIIRNGLPLDLIDRCGPALPAGFAQSEAPFVLFVGRFIDTKNVRFLLKALGTASKVKKIKIVLVGHGPERKQLELLTRKYGLEAEVYFAGLLSSFSIWSLMKTANLFVSLSAYEGCPNTVLEAMACRCPVIVSDIPAHREILNESSALFVDPWDTPQTANAIMYALLNKDESKERALNARKTAEIFLVEKMATEYERVYKSILA